MTVVSSLNETSRTINANGNTQPRQAKAKAEASDERLLAPRYWPRAEPSPARPTLWPRRPFCAQARVPMAALRRPASRPAGQLG